MLEKALKGSRGYGIWVAFLLLLVAIGFFFYLRQLDYGLGITGMSRDVSWGLYIAQFTFLVGIAASAVMLVLPYYLHDYKAFGKITILGEFLAVSAVIMCVTFVFVDLGRPDRVDEHPSLPVARVHPLLGHDRPERLSPDQHRHRLDGPGARQERRPAAGLGEAPDLSSPSPGPISIHTVTAFIYAGLPGRGFWLTAIMAPRFLASAFASGPALLILFCLILKRFTRFDAGEKAIQTLAKIVAYALATSIFFVLVELFTAFYSQIPGHMHHLTYLFAGLEGHNAIARWMTAVGIHRSGRPRLADHPADAEEANPCWPWPAAACSCRSGSRRGWAWWSRASFPPRWRRSPIIPRRDRRWPLRSGSGPWDC